MFLILLLVAVCTSRAFQPQNCGLPRGKPHARIIGGSAVTTEQYPWIIAIKKRDGKGERCTGTLISEKHVLTAAHCFEGYINGTSAVSWAVCRGVDVIFEVCPPDRLYQIEKVHFYQEYLTKGMQYDIVVLTLSREVKDVVPACLPVPDNGELRYNGTYPTDLYSAGYSDNGPYEVNILLKMASVGLPWYRCPYKGMLCTKQQESGAMCHGDSGGPLTEIHDGRHVIVGVHSGVTGGCDGSPGKYNNGKDGISVEVGLYVDWILSGMNSSESTISPTPPFSTTEVPDSTVSSTTQIETNPFAQ